MKKVHYQGKTNIQLDSLGKKILVAGTVTDLTDKEYEEVSHISGIKLIRASKEK